MDLTTLEDLTNPRGTPILDELDEYLSSLLPADVATASQLAGTNYPSTNNGSREFEGAEHRLCSGCTVDEHRALDGFCTPPMLEEYPCWGALLRGTAQHCTPNFAVGKSRFHDKFCPACSSATGMAVPAERIKAVPVWCHKARTNSRTNGFWNAHVSFPSRFRVINNTVQCVGPELIVFEQPPGPAAGPFPTCDFTEWVCNGCIFLRVSKGTLVPVRVEVSSSKRQ